MQYLLIARINLFAIKACPRGLGCTPSKENKPVGGAKVFSITLKCLIFRSSIIAFPLARKIKPCSGFG